MSEREESYSTDIEEFSESEEWILQTLVGFQAMTVTETKSWESNRIKILYEPETNTEGSANITVLFYEITERVESKFWSLKKNSKQAQA